MKKSGLVGSVLRIERTSIYDGQGLRTVLFLKGCPLRCRWCSTPESQLATLQKGYARNRCVGCGMCVCTCPEGALSLAEDGLNVITDFSKCQNCFMCVAKCLQNAHKKYGSLLSVQEVVREIVKDEIFFFHSGGGVTISGGEPLSQPDFVAEVLQECRALGIHTALETSFHAPYESIAKVLPWLNVLYVDLKLMDKEFHKQWVGTDNALILDNLQKVDQTKEPLEIIVRIPLVPGANDSDANLSATAEFCKSLKKLKEVELLPYHRLGLETYRNLDRDYLLQELISPSAEEISERASFLALQDPGVPIRVGG
ncbi:glycyl-radical enzyme activating protein [Desulfosporosinus sp. OT]|uniref:glycyl-radical enzyme activating protein n=1 Tax=Desulfosporosinus sp. OT TaxID=913865 RepID=UPI000223A1FF|nr:glycyl-radical enzyme activating protein [Desulfosporosinus sp. OT]EGW36567.1 glycyl-radical enzyme activating family protein [Desulfosporosinus sp. OT]